MSVEGQVSQTQNRIADFLFAIQLLGAVLYCGSQILRSIEDVHGVSVIHFSLAAIFVAFNLALGIGAHHAAPGRRTVQGLITYVVWLIGSWGIVLAVALNAGYAWSVQDTTILSVALGLAFLTIAFGALRKRSIRDPMMLAFFAIISKSMPQLLIVWKILEEGGSGHPPLAIFVGHCTILIRLGQIYFMVRETGWERNRFWLAISESAAELTWIAVTIAWLIML